MDLARLQAWTLKPAILISRTTGEKQQPGLTVGDFNNDSRSDLAVVGLDRAEREQNRATGVLE
jgi:hypothetical protein